MPFFDHLISQSNIRLRRSSVPGETPPAGALRPGEIAVNSADGVVFVGRNNGAATPVSGGEGASYDQSLNTTDSPAFSGISVVANGEGGTTNEIVVDGSGVQTWGALIVGNTLTFHGAAFATHLPLQNGTRITIGSFDNMTGGSNGISLHCAVGYELNWQGGRLRSVMLGDETAAPQTIHCDSPMVFNAGIVPRVVPLTYGSIVNTDASTGDIFDLTLTGNATLANPTNPADGQTVRWRITQDATGGRAVALGDKFVLPSSASSPLPFSTAADKMDLLAATYHAGRDKWDVVAFVMGY